jgi:hypothetical protein
MKRCPKCNTVKDATEFGSDKRRNDGLTALCKECRREQNKLYWAENGHKYAKGGEKERTHKPETPADRETRKRYVAMNRDRLNERQRKYYQEHKEEHKQYTEATRETRLARRREYCKKNMAKLTAQAREYAELHPERILAKKAVHEAIRRKQIAPAKKCKCADCGKQAHHLHHESYAEEQRLNVIPLCRSCHRKRHIMSNKV